MTIGERVKKRRKELGLTQQQLAERLGNSSRASICTVEKDREDLTTTRIAKLADALQVSPAYLMGWIDEDTEKLLAGKEEELKEFEDSLHRVTNIPKSSKADNTEDNIVAITENIVSLLRKYCNIVGYSSEQEQRVIKFLFDFLLAPTDVQTAIETLLTASQPQP